MTPEEAKAFLASVSSHPDRPGDTAYMHPDFAVRLATSIQQARAQGLPVGLMSGFREPGQTGSAYDAGGNSSHSYGLASDISGLDGPNGRITQAWGRIAGQNGLSNPYGVGHPAEFNHWQLPPQPLERTPDLLARLKTARATGNYQNVWNAYSATPSGPNIASATPDNRTIFFNTLVKAGLSPNQALGALWGLGGESMPSINTGAYNPKDPGGSVGAAQWLGDRRANLEAFARAAGKPVTDPQTQANFIVHELQTTEGRAFAALKNAQTPQEATRIWVSQYERPKVDNSEARIAQGARVGSVDPQGNFVVGSAPRSTATATPAWGGGGGGGGGGATPAAPYVPTMTPEQYMGQSIGHALSQLSLGGGGGGSGGSGLETTAADQPAIRMPGLDVQITNTPSPFPAEYQPGGQSIGAQLGQLGASPATNPLDPTGMSITGGAPSMTAMLPTIGTDAAYNYLDPRRTGTLPTSFRGTRIG